MKPYKGDNAPKWPNELLKSESVSCATQTESGEDNSSGQNLVQSPNRADDQLSGDFVVDTTNSLPDSPDQRIPSPGAQDLTNQRGPGKRLVKKPS